MERKGASAGRQQDCGCQELGWALVAEGLGAGRAAGLGSALMGLRLDTAQLPCPQESLSSQVGSTAFILPPTESEHALKSPTLACSFLHLTSLLHLVDSRQQGRASQVAQG